MRRGGAVIAASLTVAAVVPLIASSYPWRDQVVRATWHAPVAAPAGAPPSASSVDISPTPSEISVVASGDILLHPALWAQAAADVPRGTASGYDFRRVLAGVRDTVSQADLALCHLETPVGQPGGPFTGYPQFVVPPQILPALAETGYDSCSTASNHTLDAGEPGIRRTLTALDAAGLAHAGSASSAQQRMRPTILSVRGVRVAHLAYTFSFNGIPLPADRPWLANRLQAAAVLDEARRARAAGAEIVIASLHWGTEYRQAPDSGQTALARQLLASPDIDLLIGHHAHVVQPFERIGDKWVVYGLGNHIAHQPQRDNTQDGVLARLTFRKSADARWRVVTAEALPTVMNLGNPTRIVLIQARSRRSGHPRPAAPGLPALPEPHDGEPDVPGRSRRGTRRPRLPPLIR